MSGVPIRFLEMGSLAEFFIWLSISPAPSPKRGICASPDTVRVKLTSLLCPLSAVPPHLQKQCSLMFLSVFSFILFVIACISQRQDHTCACAAPNHWTRPLCGLSSGTGHVHVKGFSGSLQGCSWLPTCAWDMKCTCVLEHV